MSIRFKGKHNLVLTGFFLVCLFGLFFHYVVTGYGHLFLNPPLRMNALLGRVPYRFVWPSAQTVDRGEFQSQIYLALRDNFPSGGRIVSSALEVNYSLAQFILSGFPDQSSSFLPLGDSHYILSPFQRLVEKPHLFTAVKADQTRESALFYNQLVQQYPAVNMYVCYAMPPQDLFLSKTLLPGDAGSRLFAGEQYVDLFRDQLDPEIKLMVPGESWPLQEALDLFYRSDHHWKMQGAYQVYAQLIQAMSAKAPSIGVCVDSGEWHSEEGITFYGSHARMCGGFEGISDSVENSAFQLGTVVQVEPPPQGASTEPWASSDLSTDKFFNYYGYFYGGDYGLLSYKSNRENNRAILVIGDSMDNSITKLMASHFTRSYFIDLDDYEKEHGKAFSIANFIDEHAITELLFIGREWVIQSPPDRLSKLGMR